MFYTRACHQKVADITCLLRTTQLFRGDVICVEIMPAASFRSDALNGRHIDSVTSSFSQTVLADLREVIVKTTGKEPPESAEVSLEYAAALCTQLIRQQNFDPEAWRQVSSTVAVAW